MAPRPAFLAKSISTGQKFGTNKTIKNDMHQQTFGGPLNIKKPETIKLD
jgi:hypothetical protein